MAIAGRHRRCCYWDVERCGWVCSPEPPAAVAVEPPADPLGGEAVGPEDAVGAAAALSTRSCNRARISSGV